MSWLVVGPIVFPLVASILAGVQFDSGRRRQVISVCAGIGLLGNAIALMVRVAHEGVVAVQIGNWPAPFGITLVADYLSAAMVLITAVIGLATIVYAVGDVERRGLYTIFHPLVLVLLAGVCGAFLAGDIFNLYVWFEVMLIASIALLVVGGTPAQVDGAVRYTALSLMATIFLLTGIGLLYGLTGTLNMADLHLRVQQVDDQGTLTAVAIVFIVAFGIKSAVFPLFFWLPASYHTPKFAVSAIFSGLLTKVGVYALMRTFTLIFTNDVAYTHEILLWVAGLTMVTGVVGAASQNELRRILSFHIVSQIGYMILGLALFTRMGLLGGIFYVIHHIVVKANLFFAAGIVHRVGGSSELRSLGGLYRDAPLLAALFFVPAFSLAGFPPLSGFWAKFLLIRAALEDHEYVIVAVALIVGLLTAYSMTKIWLNAFWKARPADAPEPSPMTRQKRMLLVVPVAGLAAITVSIGLFVKPFYALADRAAGQLMDPTEYVEAVLGDEAARESAESRPGGGETAE